VSFQMDPRLPIAGMTEMLFLRDIVNRASILLSVSPLLPLMPHPCPLSRWIPGEEVWDGPSGRSVERCYSYLGPTLSHFSFIPTLSSTRATSIEQFSYFFLPPRFSRFLHHLNRIRYPFTFSILRLLFIKDHKTFTWHKV